MIRNLCHDNYSTDFFCYWWIECPFMFQPQPLVALAMSSGAFLGFKIIFIILSTRRAARFYLPQSKLIL